MRSPYPETCKPTHAAKNRTHLFVLSSPTRVADSGTQARQVAARHRQRQRQRLGRFLLVIRCFLPLSYIRSTYTYTTWTWDRPNAKDVTPALECLFWNPAGRFGYGLVERQPFDVTSDQTTVCVVRYKDFTARVLPGSPPPERNHCPSQGSPGNKKRWWGRSFRGLQPSIWAGEGSRQCQHLKHQ